MVPRFYADCSFTVFAFCIQELCCLDFMILVLFTTFGIAWHCLDSMALERGGLEITCERG